MAHDASASPEHPQAETTEDDAASSPRPGLSLACLITLALLALALHAPRLSGPFSDGQHGNCGAMFSIMARNALALGWSEAGLVPTLNPAPPQPGDKLFRYTHHPPGLPWLVTLAAATGLAVETGARAIALLLTIVSALLATDLAARLAGRRAAWATGLLMLALPAGLHHGLLVNYETVALPPLLYLTRALVLRRGRPAVGALWAGLSDWIALVPLLLVGAWKRPPARRALGVGALVVAGILLVNRARSPSSLGETLTQALGATFLSSAFELRMFLASMGHHLGTLYGWALPLAVLGLLLLHRRAALVRRTLLVLLGAGLLNVLVFAHHATSHEHFSLLLLPWVALSTATLLFPRDAAAMPPATSGVLALAVVLTLGLQQARQAFPDRRNTRQAALAEAFREVTEESTLYLRPEGASLVFLQRAARHVTPYAVGDLEGASRDVRAYRARFGRPDLPAEVCLEAGREPPPWVAALGPPTRRGGFVFRALPDP